jgi:CDGSH-type Zn-finger protein
MSDDTVTIKPTLNGPYEVTGTVSILDADGAPVRETTKTFLCRCGQSKSKPFCDGSHKRNGWTSD